MNVHSCYPIPAIRQLGFALVFTWVAAFSGVMGESATRDMEITFAAAVWDIDRSVHNHALELSEQGLRLESQKLYFSNGEELTEIEVPFGSISEISTYRGNGELTFYLARPDPEQGMAAPVSGTVTIPPHMQEVLLVFLPEDIENRRFRITALDLSAKTFPANNLQVFNLSSADLYVRVGESPIEVKSRGRQLIPVAEPRRSYRVSVVGRDQTTDGWRIFYNGYQRPLHNQRIMCFITDDPLQAGRYSVRFMPLRITR